MTAKFAFSDTTMILNNHEGRAVILSAVLIIRGLEAQITELRDDIKTALKSLKRRGVDTRALKFAIARAKLGSEDLEKFDAGAYMCCRSLGVSGELFADIKFFADQETAMTLAFPPKE